MQIEKEKERDTKEMKRKREADKGREGRAESQAGGEEKMRGKIRAASPHGEVGNRNCCW